MSPHSKTVFCATAPSSDYAHSQDVPVPELNGADYASCALIVLRNLFRHAGLGGGDFGNAAWNPLADYITESSRVVIKPNWVHHANRSGQGIDCLVTHTSVLEAILQYVLKARPHSVVIGDAPVQDCDFEALSAASGFGELIRKYKTDHFDLGIKDFRRTILHDGTLGGVAQQDCRQLNEYSLFDLGTASALEPITTEEVEFRVTKYDPDMLRKRHAPGKHEYLIARDVLEADVVINVPKLKTHRKACITGAMKNLVGINGNKEFLPHHRKGGSEEGGDCYSGRSHVKRVVESLLDATNRAHHPSIRRAYGAAVKAGYYLGRLLGCGRNYEGAWYGNDTVWRMCLDLLRILHYGRPDGTLAHTVQRTVITITDAIVAGEGEGPLLPTPVPLGMMTLGVNTTALEWVHALLIGFDPQAIPLVREGFGPNSYPLADFSPDEIRICLDGENVTAEELIQRRGRSFRPPRGWVGHCELGTVAQAERSARSTSCR